VIQRLEIELRALAHLAQRDVVLLGLAVGRLGVREVRKGEEQLVAPDVELAQLGLELLELGLQPARALPQLGELRVAGLAGLGRLLDLRGELVLVRPDRVGSRVELAPALIDPEQLVELVGGAAPCQGRADRLRVAADLLQVERGSVPLVRGRGPRWSWWSSPRAPEPR
jgi:hypothetical protein